MLCRVKIAHPHISLQRKNIIWHKAASVLHCYCTTRRAPNYSFKDCAMCIKKVWNNKIILNAVNFVLSSISHDEQNCNVGPTLKQHWVNVSCLRGCWCLRVERVSAAISQQKFFKPSRCIKVSFRIHEDWLNFLKLRVLEWQFSCNCYSNNDIFFFICTRFKSSSFTTSWELRLVVNEDDNGTFRLERVKTIMIFSKSLTPCCPWYLSRFLICKI